MLMQDAPEATFSHCQPKRAVRPGAPGWVVGVLALLAVAVVLRPPLALAEAPARPATVEFSRDVRPILSDTCFACHGPDEKARKANLRLDTKEGAFSVIEGRTIVVPGDRAKSELYRRLITTDADDLMPPAKAGKRLTPAQIEMVGRWIDAGAEWQSHWAYTAPRQPPLPEVRASRWPRNEIDRFVLRRLEDEGLAPSPPASQTTLLRRAALDLTGLPPTVEEIDTLLADRSAQAYEHAVDRLLTSPRYGENMARYWLDAVRYADSHGYHIDADRSIWKYREWVIGAFNQNLPFDQFTTEQLAGDLLPDATREQKIGSGFVRCNMSTGEGGAIEAEYQAKYGFDRLETMGTVWLGMTLICARCHSHKYDPVSQKEYYQLFSFFNSLDEPVMDENKPNPDPFLKLPTPEQSARLDALRTQIRSGQTRLEEPLAAMDAAQRDWEAAWRARLASAWRIVTPASLRSTGGATLDAAQDGVVTVTGTNPEKDTHEMTLPIAGARWLALRLEALPDPALPKGGSARADDASFAVSEIEAEWPAAADAAEAPTKVKFARAFANEWAESHEAGKAIDGKADTAWRPHTNALDRLHTAVFVCEAPVEPSAKGDLRLRLRYEFSDGKRALGRFRIAVADGAEFERLLFPAKGNPWHVIGPFPSEDAASGLARSYEPERAVDLKQAYPGVRDQIRWQAKPEFEDGRAHLLVSQLHGVHGVYYLHRVLTLTEPRAVEISLRGDDVFKLWLNGQVVAERTQKETPGDDPVRVTLPLAAGDNQLLWKIANYQGAAHLTFRMDRSDTNSLSADLAGVLATVGPLRRSHEQALQLYYRRLHAAELRQLADTLSDARDSETALDRAIPTTLVAKEKDKPRDTFLLVRGEYDKPGDKVFPGVPGILPAFPAQAPSNRLGLAQWLLDPAHPLTARVTVNRLWQQVFGVGLVKTAEDFGVQSDRPSHPELLDWLATEFVRTGWDVKRLMRLMLTSATYRQSAAAAAGLRSRDPENRLLARGPRQRVDAEVVRDTFLAVSGLLVDEVGGPSVKPYEPPGLWEAVSFNNSQKYVVDRDAGQYRRSLYTYWKRQSPPPAMLVFDAPTREYCLVRRPRTNTPLQALALLNDPQAIEASRAFAQRMLLEGGARPPARIEFGFRLATGRKPTAAEMRLLRSTLQKELTLFRADPEAAAKLLSVGRFKAASTLEASELAAWTALANLLLNLDETITKG
jgi:hypothetical protein